MHTTTILPLSSTIYSATVSAEASSSGVAAVVDMQSLKADRDTIHLSDDAKDRYKKQEDENESKQKQMYQGQQQAKETRETKEEQLRNLQQRLKIAHKHLLLAQEQMGQALDNMKNAANDEQRKDAISKMQLAQRLVIDAQSEVLSIHAQINDLLLILNT